MVRVIHKFCNANKETKHETLKMCVKLWRSVTGLEERCRCARVSWRYGGGTWDR